MDISSLAVTLLLETEICSFDDMVIILASTECGYGHSRLSYSADDAVRLRASPMLP